jgi:hypothetical protein
MKLREARTERPPSGRTLILVFCRVQCRHQIINFHCHDCEHRHRLISDGCESVHRTCGNLDVLTLTKVSTLVADQHLQCARQDAERFVRRLMNMRRSLVAWIWLQVPTFKDEVRHELEVTTERSIRLGTSWATPGS